MSMKFKDTIDGSISKNATTATKLETKRTIMEENYNSNDYNKKISIDELIHLQEMVASCYTDNPN